MRDFLAWLELADYEAAKNQAAIDVVKRYARGNVSFQNGWVLTKAGVDELSAAGDEAIAELQRMMPA